MKRRVIVFCGTIAFLWCAGKSCAEVIYFANGDKITGSVVGETAEVLRVKTEAMGEIGIAKSLISRVEPAPGPRSGASAQPPVRPPQKKEKQEGTWKRRIAVGYSSSSGNTQNSMRTAEFTANRKTDRDEFLFRGNYFYYASSRKMESQKWYALARYIYNFWARNWYSFHKFEADHDRFANIDYRLIPSTGIGYRLLDTESWKLVFESGIGWGHTAFCDDTDDSNELIVLPRAFLEKKFFSNSTFSQEIKLYPSLENDQEYRLRSETAWTTKLTDVLALKLSFIDDYNSDPPAQTKKHDSRFISSLQYSF